MSKVFETIHTRRSVRSFLEKEIKQEDLMEIVKAGVAAPSGMNKQTWQFTVTQDTEKIQRLANIIVSTLHRDKEYNMYRPTAIVLVSNHRENSNGLADCSCALENMFLMAHSIGIGSCWINQLKNICDEPDVRALLTEFKIPNEHIVWGIAALGYPKEEGEPKKKDMSVIKFIDDLK